MQGLKPGNPQPDNDAAIEQRN